MTPRFVFGIACCLLTVLSSAETPQDFSGEWVAARPASGAAGPEDRPDGSDAGERGRDMARGSGRRMGEGMGGGERGGMGGGRHHHFGAAPDATKGSGDASTVAGVPRSRARALTIRQSDVFVDIAADGGKRMVYRFDNRNNYGPAYGGTVMLTWSPPEMVIETHPDGGGSVEEHYRLSDDGNKLTLRLREQRAGADAVRESVREFVRSGSAAQNPAVKLP